MGSKGGFLYSIKQNTTIDSREKSTRIQHGGQIQRLSVPHRNTTPMEEFIGN